MADAVGIITTAVELALKIKDAVETVRQNREDCAHIKRRVGRVHHTLSLCEANAELMESPAVRDAVEALAEVLGDALELVTGCQEEETSAVCLCYSAGKLSKQLGKVERGITDGNCEVTFAILVYHISKQTGDGAGPATEPERGSAVPKFGDWDENDPSIGEGFTDIFEKVREEKQSTAADIASSSHTYTDCYNQEDTYESSDVDCRQDIPSEGEEDDYGGDGELLQEIARVTLAIRTAMETVRRNRDECVQIDKIASRVSLILPQLEHPETATKDGGVRRALKRLLKTFRRAHKLVVACHSRSVVVLCSPGKLSNDLRWVLDYMMRDISCLIDVLSCED